MSDQSSQSSPTIAEAVAESAARLRRAGIAGARLDAEVLLAHVLGVERAYLCSHDHDKLTPAQAAPYDSLLARRARHEPVAYLTGRRDWFDLTLSVSPAVLVPRPETEGLLELALAWASSRPVTATVTAAVDVGTGSGALAIALARRLPGTLIYATDVSGAALAVARANARRAGVDAAVTWLQGDLLCPLRDAVDLVVANLPYIGVDEHAGLMPDVRLYEPRLALVGGAHGHELIARLLEQAPKRLRAGGAIFAELGPPQAAAALAAARLSFPGAAPRLEPDLAGLARYLVVET